jgi:prophage maintenance system killer protein
LARGPTGRIRGAAGIPARSLRRPSTEIAVEINKALRADDEWFSDPDDLDRVERALDSIADLADPVEAAAVLAYRVTRAQGFAEGNKRTALLLARWVLDNNGLDGSHLIPSDDRLIADLLVRAAAGADVERDLIDLLSSRR